MPHSALAQSEEQRNEREGNKRKKKKYSRLFCFIKRSDFNFTLFFFFCRVIQRNCYDRLIHAFDIACALCVGCMATR